MDTLRSLMSRAPDDVKKRKEILIIILVADQRKDYLRQVTMDVNSEYETEVKNGLIQVIVPNESFYPNMFNLPQLYGDDQRRVYWRSKQSLDYSFLYYYCKELGEYFVQLEDDVIAASQYYRKMRAFIKKNEYNNWSVLEFGSQGFIGMTYRTKHLKTLSKFIRFFYWTRPVDWLFRDYNQIYLNGNPSNFRIRPPVFLHAGKFSSLDGQVRKLGRGAKSAQSRTEREQLLHWPGQRRYQSKEGNPLAKITSTIDQHFGSNRLRNPYGPKGVFWAKGVHKKDNITIQFNKTQNISQIVFVSGPEGFKNDRFYTTRLFVSYTKPSIDGCSDFESVGVFGTPIVQYKIEDDVKRPVWCVRLMLEKVIQKRWIMVEEIAIHVDK
ncbi:alpha-1,3-mannosyl-glycoprotein 4-beta-N-acetylglucosaminyltransferase A-like [Clytia hemisphaerica]